MPGQSEFEYHFRWTDILETGLTPDSVFELESRDQALEQHLRSFGGGCSVNFEYPYRWDQILEHDEATQALMLEDRDCALEAAIRATGGCPLEFPYRWTLVWPAILAGGWEGAMWAEENDRTIEGRFVSCTCGGDIHYITTSSSFISTLAGTGNHVLAADTTLGIWHIEATNTEPSGFYLDLLINNGANIVEIGCPTGGDLNCDIDLAAESITGTFPGDVTLFFDFSPTLVAGDRVSFQAPIFVSAGVGTPNPFSMSVSNDTVDVDLPWNNDI